MGMTCPDGANLLELLPGWSGDLGSPVGSDDSKLPFFRSLCEQCSLNVSETERWIVGGMVESDVTGSRLHAWPEE